jgi:hypothetical protein
LSPIQSETEAILALFAQAGRPIGGARARALAREISAYGGLEPAIGALAHDEAYVVLKDAMAYRVLLNERDDPGRVIARLLREAQDLDARAAPAWMQAAELMGRAAYRRAQGDGELAEQFQARASAAQALAAGFEEQAFLNRLKAAQLTADVSLYESLRDIAA